MFLKQKRLLNGTHMKQTGSIGTSLSEAASDAIHLNRRNCFCGAK